MENFEENYKCPLQRKLEGNGMLFDFQSLKFKAQKFKEHLTRIYGGRYFYVTEKNGALSVKEDVEKMNIISSDRFKAGNYFLNRLSAMEYAIFFNKLLNDRIAW